MSGPSVAAEPPAGWTDATAEIAQPPIGTGSGSTFTQWGARRSTLSGETLLVGCASTPIPGWVEDMRLATEARTTGLMNASVQRVVGFPIETRDEPGRFSLRPVGAPESTPRIGTARTFIGWDAHDVVTCFAACLSTREAAEPRACDASVLGAHLERTTSPPPPGVALGAATWAVHHPATAVTWGGALAFALGVVAVASRRRPRSRI
jgi:hypothetical protein